MTAVTNSGDCYEAHYDPGINTCVCQWRLAPFQEFAPNVFNVMGFFLSEDHSRTSIPASCYLTLYIISTSLLKAVKRGNICHKADAAIVKAHAF